MKTTQRKVYAWYGDLSDPTEYTLEERQKFFKAEGPEFVKQFTEGLEKEGKFYTRFAVYTTENKTPFV